MDSWDRFGLVILLVISLVVLGLVFNNASVSGFSIANLFNEGLFANEQQKAMTVFTILLLVLSVVTVLVTYIIHSKTD